MKIEEKELHSTTSDTFVLRKSRETNACLRISFDDPSAALDEFIAKALEESETK